jgi:hypothetical protein
VDVADFKGEATASAAHFGEAAVAVFDDGALTGEDLMPHVGSALGDRRALL